MEGEEIRPGVIATDLHDPVFGGNNTSAFFDATGIYYVDSLNVLSSFPSLYGGDTMINGATPSSAAFDDNGWVSFVDDTRSRVAAANDSQWLAECVD